MAARPDFQWASFYYPSILTALVLLKQQTWTEHTEDDEHDPVIQTYRAYASVGHTEAARLDHAAREHYLPTLRLRSSLIGLVRALGVNLDPPAPAIADVVADLNSPLTTVPATLVKAQSVFEGGGIAFTFDDDAGIVADDDTDTYTLVFYDSSAGTYTEIESGDLPWEPSAFDANDALYIGHPTVMFTGIKVTVNADAVLAEPAWEYFDDLREVAPDAVVDLGSTLRFEVQTAAYGPENMAALLQTPGPLMRGALVTITCLSTGQSETCVITTGGNDPEDPIYATTTTELGQSSPSTSPADYLVRIEWPCLDGLDDLNANAGDAPGSLNATGDVNWTLPQTTDRRWAKTDLDGDLPFEGFWIRLRRNDAAASSNDVKLAGISAADDVTFSILAEVRQGTLVNDKVGVTDGTASQTFALTRSLFMELDAIEVGDDDSWERVDNFASSSSTDKHFRLREEPDGNQYVTFGDGTRGRIPPVGESVTMHYWIGGDTSGNVGVRSITRDRSGNSKLKNVRNPRAASGWTEQQASTEAGLALAKETIPANLRTNERAVTIEDHETLAVAFRDDTGAQLVARALAVEEGAGPKTVLMYGVGPGGVALTASAIDSLETYYNGETVGVQKVGGVAMANTEVSWVSYTPVQVDVTATISVLAAYADGAQAKVETALQNVLRALAMRILLDDAGVWYESTAFQWEWEGTVEPAILLARIATAVNGVVAITMSDPAAPITLAAGELPVPGTIAITITEV